MEIESLSTRFALILLPLILSWGWMILKWVWLTPKKLERLLRQQGLSGNSYKFLTGDMMERSTMHREAESRPIGLLDDIVSRVEPFLHKSVHTHGKNSFVWFGTTPTVIIMNPDQVKDVLLKIFDFQKPHMYPAAKMLVDGLVYYEGEKWVTQRKVMTSAFHMEKLKLMLPTFHSFCDEMVTRWEKSASFMDGRCEVDAWTELENLTRDMITQAAFGKCAFEEGKRVFELQQELIQLVKDAVYTLSIPGWRFLPTKQNRRMNKVNQEVESLVLRIIRKREKEMETSGETANDLLGYLLESNMKVNQENKGKRYEVLSTEDLILECKQFHLAGQLPTLVVLAWTMVLLSIHPEWQSRAREEVLQVFGGKKPDFDALGKLKIVTMIVYEVMRLYPPVPTPFRTVRKDTKLGKLTLPAGVQLVLPTILIHHDQELWGYDANEFKPERFSEGLSKATNNQVSFFPFSWGPRMCIGQNFALLEVKMAIAMIMQRFWFELSPSYAHAPMAAFLLQPQHGVQLVLHKC